MTRQEALQKARTAKQARLENLSSSESAHYIDVSGSHHQGEDPKTVLKKRKEAGNDWVPPDPTELINEEPGKKYRFCTEEARKRRGWQQWTPVSKSNSKVRPVNAPYVEHGDRADDRIWMNGAFLCEASIEECEKRTQYAVNKDNRRMKRLLERAGEEAQRDSGLDPRAIRFRTGRDNKRVVVSVPVQLES